jgi:hypothetical protein
LNDAGIASASLTSPEGVLGHEITMFKDVLRIDVQTRTAGIDFSQAWQQRVERSVDGVAYWIVSREHLIAMTQAAGRPKDLEDVRVLSRRDGD